MYIPTFLITVWEKNSDAQGWEFKQNETNTSYNLHDLKCFDFLLLRDCSDKILKLFAFIICNFLEHSIYLPKRETDI